MFTGGLNAFKKGFKEADKTQKEIWDLKNKLIAKITKLIGDEGCYYRDCIHCGAKKTVKINISKDILGTRTPAQLEEIIKILNEKV